MKKIIKSLGVLALSIYASILYRCGGSGNWPRWFRPVGIGTATLAGLWIMFGFHWGIIPSAGAMAGLSTTYFKKKGMDARWYNWLFVGLALSLAILPCIYFIPWQGFLIRSIICTLSIMIWSELIGNAVIEELGRGFIAIGTLPLLLIRF